MAAAMSSSLPGLPEGRLLPFSVSDRSDLWVCGSDSPLVISEGKIPGYHQSRSLRGIAQELTAIWLTLIFKGKNSVAMTLLICTAASLLAAYAN